VIRADIALTYEGKSRGFGFVLFDTVEDAKNAIGMKLCRFTHSSKVALLTRWPVYLRYSLLNAISQV
jgi:hypothetical protein